MFAHLKWRLTDSGWTELGGSGPHTTLLWTQTEIEYTGSSSSLQAALKNKVAVHTENRVKVPVETRRPRHHVGEEDSGLWHGRFMWQMMSSAEQRKWLNSTTDQENQPWNVIWNTSRWMGIDGLVRSRCWQPARNSPSGVCSSWPWLQHPPTVHMPVRSTGCTVVCVSALWWTGGGAHAAASLMQPCTGCVRIPNDGRKGMFRKKEKQEKA